MNGDGGGEKETEAKRGEERQKETAVSSWSLALSLCACFPSKGPQPLSSVCPLSVTFPSVPTAPLCVSLSPVSCLHLKAFLIASWSCLFLLCFLCFLVFLDSASLSVVSLSC